MKRSKSLLILAAVVVTGGSFHQTARAANDDPAAKIAIARVGEAYVEAFDKGDAKAVAAFWTPEGDYVDQAGHVSSRGARKLRPFSRNSSLRTKA